MTVGNSSPAAPGTGRPTVLIAIRHPAMRRLTMQLLALDTCWATVELDGEMLASALQRLQPDLLVIDIQDFPACCRTALAAYPPGRVIVVGPEPDVGYEAAALVAGAGAAVARDDIATDLTTQMRRLLHCPPGPDATASATIGVASTGSTSVRRHTGSHEDTAAVTTDRTRSAVVGEPLSADEVRDIVATAVRAPSLHNTQPWTFRLTASGIELRADLRRQLPATDPTGRELLISCGAALFGARLAIHRLGREPIVNRWPDRRDPTLLAVIDAGRPVAVPPMVDRLIRATYRRHTQRFGFSERTVSPQLLAALQREAETHHTRLLLVDHARDRQLLARFTSKAEGLHRRDPLLVRETSAWTPATDAGRRDGVPAAAYLQRPARAPLGVLPVHDFALGRPQGQRPSGTRYAPPVIAILTTNYDISADWLNAGETLHHLLLTAADQWVFATVHSQPLRHPATREAIRRHLHLHDHPQMLLSLGHSPTAALSPRRPVDDVITTGGPPLAPSKEKSR